MSSSERVYPKKECQSLKFDLSDPDTAVSLYKACKDVDGADTDLQKRFRESWAQLAVDKGVPSAVEALKDKDIRDILVSEDEWNAAVRELQELETSDNIYSHWIVPIFVITILLFLLCCLVMVCRCCKKDNQKCGGSSHTSYKKKGDSSRDSCCNDLETRSLLYDGHEHSNEKFKDTKPSGDRRVYSMDK